ncbi:hypothetical protein Tco_0578967 [Tanacetum coccineum]
MDEDIQADEEVRTPSPKQDQPEPSQVQESASDSSNPDLKKFDNILPLTERQLIKYLKKLSRVLFSRIAKKQWEHHEEADASYADLKALIDQYYDENIAHRDQTDKLVEASMSSLDRSSTAISDLYKGLDVITQLLKDINNAVKDDPAANHKINEATNTFARISSNITEVLSLVKGFDLSALLSTMKDLQAHALKREEASDAWTKSSTNMAWNLGSRMTAVEISQTALKSEVSSLRQETSEIKSMMVEIYQAFKGQPFSAPSGSVTPTLALTHIPAMLRGNPSQHQAIVASVFRNNDKRNFDVHQPFKFSDFGITELDELGPIIQKKKNILPEQASSQTSGRKRKHMELEPEVKVPGLKCNRSLPEGAFQRWDDIHKVGVESLVSYLVMASMVKTEENARFSLKLRKMIVDHPDQDKLKSKKVKLEALGYHVNVWNCHSVSYLQDAQSGLLRKTLSLFSESGSPVNEA